MKHKDIERILRSIKTEDDDIITGQYKVINLKGMDFKIHQLNWYYKWHKFSLYLGMFFHFYTGVVESLELPEKKDDLKEFIKNIRLTLSNVIAGKRAFKYVVRICRLYGWRVRKMKRLFSLDDWAELFLWVFVYNILGQKKSLKTVWQVISKARSV